MSAAKSHLLLGVALLAGAQLAQAGEPAGTTGLVQLPNVRIVNATDAQRSAMSRWDAQAASGAFRAYKDPDTGELRDQSPEEALKAGAASKAAARSAPPITFTAPRGGTVMSLDESYMSNSVVTKDASGRIAMQCVTGSEAAITALVTKSVKKEDRHDH